MGRLGGFLLLGLLAGRLPAAGAEPRFGVEEATSTLVEGVYRLDARVAMRLSPAVIGALESGVPITFQYRIRVLRERDYLWDQEVASLYQRYQLEYHALSERYLLVNLNTGVSQVHRSLDGALASLGRLQDFPLIDAQLLPPGPRYTGEVQVYLESESLPVPLLVQYYLDASWRLASEPVRWPLAP
jgi:hypothetical protein